MTPNNRAATAIAELRARLGVDAVSDAEAEAWFERSGIETKQGWLRDGLLVPGADLARCWTMTEDALAAACAAGQLFSVPFQGRCWYLAVWLGHAYDEVAAINQAFGPDIDSVSKAIFWWSKHGGLRGLSLHDALAAGVPLAHVLRAVQVYGAESRGERIT
jgi:hypothetical protein